MSVALEQYKERVEELVAQPVADVCAGRQEPSGERGGRVAEALTTAEHLRRIDADQTNLPNPTEPKRVPIGVTRDNSRMRRVGRSSKRMRIRAAAGSEERKYEQRTAAKTEHGKEAGSR